MKEPRACECGCGEMTKGGRFRPGHDSRMHSQKKKSESIQARISAPKASSKIELPTTTRTNKSGMMPGMRVHLDPPHLKWVVDAIVYFVSPFGWVATVDEAGKQKVGHEDWATLVEADTKRVMAGATPEQKQTLSRLLG